MPKVSIDVTIFKVYELIFVSCDCIIYAMGYVYGAFAAFSYAFNVKVY